MKYLKLTYNDIKGIEYPKSFDEAVRFAHEVKKYCRMILEETKIINERKVIRSTYSYRDGTKFLVVKDENGEVIGIQIKEPTSFWKMVYSNE